MGYLSYDLKRVSHLLGAIKVNSDILVHVVEISLFGSVFTLTPIVCSLLLENIKYMYNAFSPALNK